MTGSIWGPLPDSVQKAYSIRPHDTILVVIDTFLAMPDGEIVVVTKNGGDDYPPPIPIPPTITVEPGSTKCLVSIGLNNVTCANNKTPEDPDDDTFYFDMQVSGTNTGSGGWVANIGGKAVSGAYDVPKRVEGIKITKTPYTLSVADAQKTDGKASTQSSPLHPALSARENHPFRFSPGA